jgi:hypothetical protein
LTAWIALVAMLGFALLPTASRALAFANGSSSWAEICTPQGMRLLSLSVDSNGSPADAPSRAGDMLDHCALCAMAGAGTAPLAMATPALPLRSAGVELPRHGLQAAFTPHAWCSAQPRGPPSRA